MIGTSATSTASSNSLSSSQPEDRYKQELIRYLNRGIPELRKSVKSLRTGPGFDSSPQLAQLTQRLEATRESWAELKDRFRSMTEEHPNAIFEAVQSRIQTLTGLIDRMEGL